MAETELKANPATMPNQAQKAVLPVDLIRSVGIFLVILLHVAIEPVPIPPQLSPINVWFTVSIYNSIARPCVPLFVMLSGYLLLQPSKVNEPLKAFFKKRWMRVGLPFFFWAAIYFVYVMFVSGESTSAGSVLQNMLLGQGSYVVFWYLYMLVGLYLLTPILRVLMTYSNENLLRFLLLVWFIGTGVMPMAGLIGLHVNNNLFVFPVWIGYFLLGAYLPRLKAQSWKLFLLMGFGFAWTFVGTIFMEMTPGSNVYFFYDYLTANVIVASAAMFVLLISVSTKRLDRAPGAFKKLIKVVGKNTLPIYLFHMLLLEAFRTGVFGFTLTVMSFDPIIMVPLLSFLTLFLSLAIIVPAKKVPYLKKLIG